MNFLVKYTHPNGTHIDNTHTHTHSNTQTHKRTHTHTHTLEHTHTHSQQLSTQWQQIRLYPFSDNVCYVCLCVCAYVRACVFVRMCLWLYIIRAQVNFIIKHPHHCHHQSTTLHIHVYKCNIIYVPCWCLMFNKDNQMARMLNTNYREFVI